jgi:hypothetical protein
MTRKQDESHKGQKKRPEIPSTGRGAASAMDALIKRRITAPGQGNPPAPPAGVKKH